MPRERKNNKEEKPINWSLSTTLQMCEMQEGFPKNKRPGRSYTARSVR